MHIIAGLHKGHVLKTPKSYSTRPTSSRLRETFFNICQGIIEDAVFLDLFAGSGAIGLEALSRGAQNACFIEQNKECVECIKSNIERLHLQKQSSVLCGDVFVTLEQLKKKQLSFDIIYADPPYEKQGFFNGKPLSYSQHLLTLIDNHACLKLNGYLYLEDVATFNLEDLNLKTLQLISQRKAGKATLYEFQKK